MINLKKLFIISFVTLLSINICAQDGSLIYEVKKGDTLLKLATEYGVGVKALRAANGGLPQGIKEGDKIIIPGIDYDNNPTWDAAKKDPNYSGTEQLYLLPGSEPHKMGTQPVVLPIEVVYNDENTPLTKVVVCLPFLLDEENVSNKIGSHATDFLKGFMLGIDSLSVHYGNPKLNIVTVDSKSPEMPFDAINKRRDVFDDANLIIAPDQQDRIDALGRYGKNHSIYVFNTFQARDTTWMGNDFMIQGNIPANEMYERVSDYIVNNLNGAVPVFLDNEKAKKDKQPFAEVLCSKLLSKGIGYKTVKYNGVLTSSALEAKLPPMDVKYMFIPLSGSLAEFQKFAPALINYKKLAQNEENNGYVTLFGYPEYTRFLGDALEKLKSLETSYYSRFYNGVNDNNTLKVQDSYINRYGALLPDGIPNQALYGFDVARWILEKTASGGINEQSILSSEPTDFLETKFIFQKVPGGGYVNDNLFIVVLLENSDPKIFSI